MDIKNTSDANFEQDVLKADKPVIVDFWAEWCGPCKPVAAALEEIGGELDGQIEIAKVNVDHNPTTPQRYGIRGLPTLMLFRDGQVVATKVGAAPKGDLKGWVEALL